MAAKKTFLGTVVALFLVQMSQKLSIGRDLLDCIKKGDVEFDLLEDLQDLHLSRLFLESIWK